MKTLSKENFEYKDIVSYGNMFLLGNGHIGYRGTLEEFTSKENVGLNIIGFYDRYKNLWRESLNAPNPFYIYVRNNLESCSVLENKPIKHSINLDIQNGMFSRETQFGSLNIKSERFVSSLDNYLCCKYEIKANKDIDIEIKMGVDDNIWEINGPHFKKKNKFVYSKRTSFVGVTNEKKILSTITKFAYSGFSVEIKEGFYFLRCHLNKNETRKIYIRSDILENQKIKNTTAKISGKLYKEYKKAHISRFFSNFNFSRIIISGDKEAQDEMDYSLYQLLILGNEKYTHSIPARGLSGQTYKGAIFWDTEIFMMPVINMINPKISRNALMYRIKTLDGAKEKAKEYGFDGAFYPWESQEGKEMCSKYNVVDPITNKPIRTYFNEKQIHISGDIAIALDEYIEMTNDTSPLEEGGLEMLIEIYKFFKSYSNKDINGKYHLNDVIGPDEYHERVNNNAFTNFTAKRSAEILLKYLPKNHLLINDVQEFIENIVEPNLVNGIIEQFNGYFKLEDVDVNTVKSRIKHPREYLGGKKGVAYPTKVIKQADVVALIALNEQAYSKETAIRNYEYYSYYTEHGSSLSSSMHCIVASHIGKLDEAYRMFRKSASIDLGTDQKMYAGDIYIGGTHPASNGGSYLSIVKGFLGMKIVENCVVFEPNLPDSFKKVELNYWFRNKMYHASITKKKVEINRL